MIKEFKKDNMLVKVAETRAEMGAIAGADAAAKIKELLAKKDELNIIFAAAPSQNETLAALVAAEGIEWNRINAFHMDEYIGLDESAPQRFGNFLKAAIFDKVNFKSVHYIGGNDPGDCARYNELMKNNHIDMVCLGIGENGHIAFNDPHVADFEDKELIKEVALDDVCRQQQVNDGCFKTIDDVPKSALTLTIPTLFNADYLICSVPGATKANAIHALLNDEISLKCPASIMRKHANAIVYCDSDSYKA